MNGAPILSLNDVTLGFGGDALIEGAGLHIYDGDRIALVGRNGSGKSTLLRLMAGQVEPDDGEVVRRDGIAVAVLEQSPDTGGFDTLGAFARQDVPGERHHLVDRAMAGLGLDPDLAPQNASGGEVRRAALARLIATDAELLLLDEPTNHLDIAAIVWLEEYLSQSEKAFVLISHDRAFLRKLTRRTVWVDRGAVRTSNHGFDAFEAWRDKTYEEEALSRHKLNRLIKAEVRWAVEGISARRKRNMGRVRRLQELRAERAGQRARTGTAALDIGEAGRSGKLVCEARGISKRFGDTVVVRDFSIRIARGDRLAFVGPNGVGKTSLIRVLIGEDAPDEGTVRLGTNLEVLVFDQKREALDPGESPWTTLTQDRSLGVSGKNDQVMVRGAPRHVAGYLKDFQFAEEQFRAPVSSLSGGEKARLVMAKLLARPCNLLVLDEPTNDLDIETLDLLQELIDGFAGTVLLISHDRDFVDRIAERVVVLTGKGETEVHAGGYSEYLAAAQGPAPVERAKPRKAPRREAEKSASREDRLTFAEQHRLDAIPGEIDKVSADISKLETILATPDLYAAEPAKFRKATDALVERQARLDALETEWLELEEKKEGGR